MSEPKKRPRLGIFGGSFHPPHEGHLSAARLFLLRAELDFLFVIPAFLPPHKDLDAGASAEDRFEMARIAFAPLGARVRVLRTEIEKQERCYTVDTLSAIARDFPEYELFLYVGSDMFLSLETWHEFRRLFTLCTVAFCARERDAKELKAHACYLEKTYGLKSLYLGDCPRVSSTQVREKLFQGAHPASIDQNVSEYIENHGLYRP